MIRHKKTGAEFKTRKEAKELIGVSKFRRLARLGEFEYIFEEKNSKKDE